jgi:hypothetical protein
MIWLSYLQYVDDHRQATVHSFNIVVEFRIACRHAPTPKAYYFNFVFNFLV